mmetsp:Transcript_45067/g.139067  ORF Transcript_45067/g.139067 Transcript_45067/m.139067 type:complete len:274 (+) Transcript_45067:182-1003(+)
MDTFERVGARRKDWFTGRHDRSVNESNVAVSGEHQRPIRCALGDDLRPITHDRSGRGVDSKVGNHEKRAIGDRRRFRQRDQDTTEGTRVRACIGGDGDVDDSKGRPFTHREREGRQCDAPVLSDRSGCRSGGRCRSEEINRRRDDEYRAITERHIGILRAQPVGKYTGGAVRCDREPQRQVSRGNDDGAARSRCDSSVLWEPCADGEPTGNRQDGRYRDHRNIPAPAGGHRPRQVQPNVVELAARRRRGDREVNATAAARRDLAWRGNRVGGD